MWVYIHKCVCKFVCLYVCECVSVSVYVCDNNNDLKLDTKILRKPLHMHKQLSNRYTCLYVQQETRISCIARSFLCYFFHFHCWSSSNNSNELCILSHTGIIPTAETSIVCFIGFHHTKKSSGTWELLFRYDIIFKLFAYCSNVDLLEYAYGRRGGDQEITMTCMPH